MSRERAAGAEWLRGVGEPQLADAFERGEHLRAVPHPMGRRSSEHYPCGHPRTPENSQRVGRMNGVRCRTCRLAMVARLRLRR